MDYLVDNFLEKKITINNGTPFIAKRFAVWMEEILQVQDENGKYHKIDYNDTIVLV